MSSDEESEFGPDRARRHHLAQVNGVLRRPGMYDSYILPAGALRDATASVYAEIAHRLGWLDLDRALSEAEFRQLSTDVGDWVTQDRTLSEVIETYGPPSLRIGGTNPFYPRTLAYTTTEPGHNLICFHLWNAFANIQAGTGLQGIHPEPVLLAVRHRPGTYPDSFSFTPEGLHRKPAADQQSPLRSTVWIFHGDRARYASGVFDTLDTGLAWAAEHQVTGLLAEYATGGAYDIAISAGRFTPTKAHHGTADHVAAFAPGLRHIHLTDGRQD